MRRVPGLRQENLEFFALPENERIVGKCRAESQHSLRLLASKYTRSQRKRYKFLRDTLLRRVDYTDIARLRGSGAGTNALVIGNGPSRELLSADDIRHFQKSGGYVYAVNYFGLKDSFSGISPDVLTFSDPDMIDEVPSLLAATGAKPSIVVMPLKRITTSHRELLGELQIRVLGMCDDEARFGFWGESRSIRPDRPRSYESMTLYKALAVALWCNHSKIFVIGMDNTYPKDIYCDESNVLWHRETHADTADSRTDWSQLYCSVSDALIGFSLLFSDLRKFSDERVLNLDALSLVDSFTKVSLRTPLPEVLRA